MNRFITIKNEQGGYDMINAQHIITVENMYDGKIQLRAVNGMKYIVDESEWSNISGHNHIVQLHACAGIAAEITNEGIVHQRPVSVLALMADGTIRPMNARLEFMDSIYGNTYLGLVPFEAYVPDHSA